MMSFKKWMRLVVFVLLACAGSMTLLSYVSFASQVQVCKKVKQSLKVKNQKQRKVYCTIKPATGRVGDFVEIKNKYNYIVAIGRIVKRSRYSSVVVLSTYRKDMGSMAGYPVLIRDQGNQDYWTATTAPF